MKGYPAEDINFPSQPELLGKESLPKESSEDFFNMLKSCEEGCYRELGRLEPDDPMRSLISRMIVELRKTRAEASPKETDLRIFKRID